MWFIVVCTRMATIRFIKMVKMLWTHEAQPSESATNYRRGTLTASYVVWTQQRQISQSDEND